MQVSLDNGSTFQSASEGVRISFAKVFVPGDDGAGELLINATMEGLIIDVWSKDSDGTEYNAGTSSDMVEDLVERVVEEGSLNPAAVEGETQVVMVCLDGVNFTPAPLGVVVAYEENVIVSGDDDLPGSLVVSATPTGLMMEVFIVNPQKGSKTLVRSLFETADSVAERLCAEND